MIQKLKCWLGFHKLIVSESEMALLNEALKNPLARVCGLGTFSDGKPVVFYVCEKCGAKR